MPCDERLPEPGWRAHDIAGAGQKPTPVDDLIVWTDPVMAIGASAHPRAGYPCACDGAHFERFHISEATRLKALPAQLPGRL